MGLVEDRRALHQIPELVRDLPETRAYLERALSGLGCRVFSPEGSSVCALFDFGRPDALAFRADMDALPILEATGLPFASRHKGKMHACGHDGHMAVLLGLARDLAGRSQLPHNVLLVFQPAEETGGGAKDICRSGVFARQSVRAIFGLHLWPDLPAGTVASRAGPMMTRSSEVTVEVTGRSAHVARAEEGLDALAACAAWYQGAAALERSLPQDTPRLLKFGRMEAGTVRNAVAGSARLEGTLRTFQDELHGRLQAQLQDLSGHVERETGCQVAVRFSEGYPALINPPALLEQVQKLYPVAPLARPALITEDFSWYQQALPGLFFFLGCGPAPALHAADFDFDEGALSVGLDLFRAIAEGMPCN